MDSKLYYRAYKFLKLIGTSKDCFTAIDDLKYKDREQVVKFLRKTHRIKFI